MQPADIIAIIDTREKMPVDLSPLKVERKTLVTGDYSVKGLENEIAIERKSLPDLLGCVGRERVRFDKEIKRLVAYPCKALVIEASWYDLEVGHWKSLVTPSAVTGSVLGWMAHGIPVVMAGDHDKASYFISRILFMAARRRWYNLQSFYKSLKISE